MYKIDKNGDRSCEQYLVSDLYQGMHVHNFFYITPNSLQ